jgi:hypothetical protein
VSSALKCVICKISLNESSTSSICEKSTCLESAEQKQSLHEKIEVFSTYWKDKTPNEDNYKTYLEMVNLENLYKSEAIVGELPAKFSRRAWFTGNVIQAHHAWPDEFGRKKSEII